MVEEFQEADVLWPDYTDDQQQQQEEHGDVDVPPTREDYSEPCRRWASLVAAGRNATSSSSTKPVRVPVPSHLSRSLVSYFLHGAGDIVGDDYIGSNVDGGMMSTPPHIVASRRMREKKVAFSMCSGGKGRTLKGRDLRRVRNAVLKMTGFLES